MEFPKDITIGQKYRPAMEIVDQFIADEYFEACVQHMMSLGHPRDEAERIERNNLGYYAGYYDIDTRVRVEHLFRCAHPIFGAISEHGQPTAQTAYQAGLDMGERRKRE